MDLAPPRPGEVIRYAYLWMNEAKAGRREGVKIRPCAVVMAVEKRDGQMIVSVSPITHAPPVHGTRAVEIPREVKIRLGLDDERSWVACNEINDFVWPGTDISAIPHREPSTVRYGFLPSVLFAKIKAELIASARNQGLDRVHRDT
ncbi:hypothetical protein [Terrarubrum flagellatum]|uniref:hypothetical protein n=1 Tax=Terrirubrum flagellatum TaxID=2895980 RepID=UPI0031452C4C